jgi:AcrR family transcriptional regulator
LCDDWPNCRSAAEDRIVTDSDWRSRRWDATHQRIYDAAMGLFDELGFERVNVGQIAGRAGVSVPTFYAHYPSKEHVVMQLPTTEQMAMLMSTQPREMPLRDRLVGIAPVWLSQWTSDERADMLTRWRIIASTPALRIRAAEFERTTAEMLAAALAAEAGGPVPQADVILVYAYMAAFTSGLLAWADCGGERKVEELMDEAFSALQGR